MGDLIITCNDLLWAGHPNLAIEHFEEAIAFEPAAQGWSGLFRDGALGHFFARRPEKSVAMLLLWLQERPNWPPCLRFLASRYAHLGRMRDAQAIVEKLSLSRRS
jgi:hypothetical protein